MATKKVAKKASAKKVAKKVAKKASKKAPAKKIVKKVAKKAPTKKVAKKVVKKTTSKRASAGKIVVPPVPVGGTRVSTKSVETKSIEVSTSAVATTNTSSPKKQNSSNRVVLAVVIGILALGAIVLSQGSDSSTNESVMPTESVSPSATESETSMVEESESPSAMVGSVAAPLGIVAKYTATGATIFWNASTATEGLTGYSIEFSSNGGAFTEVTTVGTDVFKYDITKSDTAGWTSFKISAVYSDGQKAEGKVFGLPGQYK